MKYLLPLGDEGQPLPPSKGTLVIPSSPEPFPYTIEILLTAGSPITNNGTLLTTIPPENESFSKDKFHEIPVPLSFTKDVIIPLVVNKPGVYALKIEYDEPRKATKTNYIVVQPSLYLQDRYLPLNSVSIQSVVSKWIGPILEWDTFFARVALKGYNMVHFTPLQQRGDSNSPYSIHDQLKFDPLLFSSVDEVATLVSRLHKKHGLLSLTDVVWNHTASDSTWLKEHPNSGYSRETAPHLAPADDLDAGLLKFSQNMAKLGYETNITAEEHIGCALEGVKLHVYPEIKLWEYYAVSVDDTLKDLEKRLKAGPISQIGLPKSALISPDALGAYIWANYGKQRYGRFGKLVDIEGLASSLLAYTESGGDSQEPLALLHLAKQVLDGINVPFYREYDEDMAAAIKQLADRIRYLRLADNGPKLGPVSDKSPLFEPYFTRFKGTDGKSYALANNGWVWNGNPLVDFASDKSKAYLRREVIVWADCVKLRYGKGPEDSPYLWKHMTEYTQICARIFDGFRIDNCHLTPVHVGEALLDAARAVKPNLYVVAELFSGSEELDRLFVERLGICSLLREAMQAWSVEELSRLVHRHAGRPIGSYRWLPLDDYAYPSKNKDHKLLTVQNRASEIEIPTLLSLQEPHALFMDCTHDNEMPAQKRTVEDTLPTAALVGLSLCAVGSVFGFDECYPALLDVVHEKRRYYVGENGIGSVKKKLYLLRDEISRSSLSSEDHETYLHHEGQYITLHRINARTGEGIFLIARTKFLPDGDQKLAPVRFDGGKTKYEFGYSLQKVADPKENSGTVEPVEVRIKELKPPTFEYSPDENATIITLPEDFPQGSITVLRTQYLDVNQDLDKYLSEGAIEASEELSLVDLNAVLYKCEAEERDASQGNAGVYEIPGIGSLVYAGLQGWVLILKPVIGRNDLGGAFSNHLRVGEWALDYVSDRLLLYESNGISKFNEWLRTRMAVVKKLPFFLRPKYFALVIGTAYEACRLQALTLLGPLFQGSTHFLQNLGMMLVQMVGITTSGLDPFKEGPSMAAGLPHFLTGWARCWGRDIFILLRGQLLATGRYEEAKDHILKAGATLKHGLIPNLIDSGRNPRYNARDATWFWIQAIQDYVNVVPNGERLLTEKVKRRFPLDDTYVPYDSPLAFQHESTLEELLFEVFQRHAKGISYREANAGPSLDRQMKSEGFNVEIHVDWNTGLIFGGSQYNCGTWMDKMGESEKAGNKGVPGTPRDGCAVEIAGLLKSLLRFVNTLRKRGLFKHDKVETLESFVSFEDWEKLVQKNFEKCFYVPLKEGGDYDVDWSIVHRRGIYKDLYRSGKAYEDYQLRPNFSIAMTVSPELFDPEHAWLALQLADSAIRGPIGMATLDPADYNYRPYYVNSEDSEDFATAKGRNYHQGPEWVWLTGYFLRAYAHFFKGDQLQRRKEVLKRMDGHRKWISESEWRGLTELTNKAGSFCADSSPTQAWSGGCLIDVFFRNEIQS